MHVSAGVPLSLQRQPSPSSPARRRLSPRLRRPWRLGWLFNLDVPRRVDITIRIASGSVTVVGWLFLVALLAGDPRIQLP